MIRPRILVTCWRRPLPTYLGERTVLDTLDPAYAGRVADAGGLPLVLSRPPGEPAQVVEEVLALADGLLLTGGGDVDPASYGAEPENVEDPDAGADAWELAAGSRVQRALGGDRIAVNTIHHHEIADAGELEVTATAPGGVIEAIEPRSEWPCVGVQWHPEKMGEPEQAGLFAQLVGAARERSAVASDRSRVASDRSAVASDRSGAPA